MKDAYPNERLNHIPHTSNDSQYPEDGIYVYHGKMIKLQYKVTHGFVTSVTIGERCRRIVSQTFKFNVLKRFMRLFLCIKRAVDKLCSTAFYHKK